MYVRNKWLLFNLKYKIISVLHKYKYRTDKPDSAMPYSKKIKIYTTNQKTYIPLHF